MKSYSLSNKKEENLVFGHFLTFIIWLYLSAIIVTELFLTKEPKYSINIISIIFLVSLISFYLSSYLKVKHTELFNLRALKLVAHIDLAKCLFNIKRVAIFEEMLKANFINIVILIVMTTNHALTYRNIHINSLLLFIAISIQMYCYLRLIKLKNIQATLYFSEVNQAYQITLNEQKELAESEKHLPWLKRTF